MARNTQEKLEEVQFQEVQNTAESNWASHVINTLLTEAERGQFDLPEGFSMHGVSMCRSQKSDGWAVIFHINRGRK